MAKPGPERKYLTEADYRQALKVPHAERGMTIGLFGGSFNPPHEGHVLVSEHALVRVGLDQVWWLVSPGNPLKDHSQLLPLKERIGLCRQIARHPAIKITGLEATYKTRYTQDTLALLKKIRPRLNFVWIMGADNLEGFHKWQNWHQIAEMMPIVVVDRPGSTLSYRSSKAARALSAFRVKPENSRRLARRKPPAWSFIHGPRSHQSSTKLRAAK